MEHAISAQNLTRSFGKTKAVRDVSFSLEPGRAYGLIGPNGAGKTTTIQMLIGLYPPSSGSISVLGRNPVIEQESLDIRRRVGYVPEKHFIHRDLTADNVLDFASRLYPTWDAAERVRIVGLLNLPLRIKVKDMSRGDVAKLALAVALSHKPELLILDEPTSGLDPLVRSEFLEAISSLINTENRTVFFSSHIMSDIERVAASVLVMDEGQLIAREELAALRKKFTQASFLFDTPPSLELSIPEARSVKKGACEWTAVFDHSASGRLSEIASRLNARQFTEIDMTLDDIFMEMLGRKGGER